MNYIDLGLQEIKGIFCSIERYYYWLLLEAPYYNNSLDEEVEIIGKVLDIRDEYRLKNVERTA